MPERIRVCVGCAQRDDHPRHVIANEGGQALWHHDCHALAGCETCTAVVASADGLQGDELRQHKLAGGADDAVRKVLDHG